MSWTFRVTAVSVCVCVCAHTSMYSSCVSQRQSHATAAHTLRRCPSSWDNPGAGIPQRQKQTRFNLPSTLTNQTIVVSFKMCGFLLQRQVSARLLNVFRSHTIIYASQLTGKSIVTKCVTWGRSGGVFNKYGPLDHKAMTCWLFHRNKLNKSRFPLPAI